MSRSRFAGREPYGPPPFVANIIRCGASVYFASPLIFTLTPFLCVGSSLVILIMLVADPFLVGEYTIVTSSCAPALSSNDPPSVSVNGGSFGAETVTFSGPVPTLVIVTVPVAVACGAAFKSSFFGLTSMRPPPGVGVAVGVKVAVAVAVVVAVFVAVAVDVAVALRLAPPALPPLPSFLLLPAP